MSRRPCPVTRSQFRTHAKALQVAINGVPLLADVKEFSTGSLGWFHNGKVTVQLDGQVVTVQVGLNLTIVGSKELPPEAEAKVA